MDLIIIGIFDEKIFGNYSNIIYHTIYKYTYISIKVLIF